MSSDTPEEVPASLRSLAMAAPRPGQAMHPPSRPLPPRRARIGITVACEPCRKRKSRCNGQRPRCASCIHRGLHCQYVSATASETNSEALKRKVTEMQQRIEDHERLYAALRTMSEQDSRAVLDKLRLGADVSTVLRQIKEGDLLLQLSLVPESRRRYEFPYSSTMPAYLQTPDNPYLRSPVYGITIDDRFVPGPSPSLQPDDRLSHCRGVYVQPYHSATIIDDRLSEVELSRWTSVTADNRLMRKMLHAYLLHEYPTFPALHKDIFLQAAIDNDKRFCSPLLVNALLAEASHCFIGLPHRDQFWNPKTLGYSFLAEAKRLWELYADTTVDLPTLQATLILHITYSMHGMDKIGFPYLVRAVTMAKQLRLLDGNKHIRSTRLRHARDFTAWCLFNWQTLMGYYYFRAPIIKAPPASALPDPDRHPSWYGGLVLRYSLNPTPFLSPLGLLFNVVSRLRVIINDLAILQFGNTNSQDVQGLTAKSVRQIQSRLESCMEYQALAFAVTQIRTAEHLPSPVSPASSDEKGAAETWQGGGLGALRRLETVARLYFVRHSFEFCDAFLLLFLSTLGMAALESLREAEGDAAILRDVRSTLILSIKGLRDQGQHIHMAAATYRLLRSRLSPEDLSAVRGHAQWNPVDENEPLVAQHIQSEWPLAILGRDGDPEASSLEALASKYDRLSLEETNDSASEDSQSGSELGSEDQSMETT
ncbi:C6 transcription factor [Purpureocillium lilacinum]|uniref:C6 transcription factor n=1 Tax=Purpureocillium lilacinum TaxID=33203 RepID=A0A179GEP0_PURLI|nr:C6 transcription factor [Purpureocillium lilacinum]